jgi:hypothetical protein
LRQDLGKAMIAVDGLAKNPIGHVRHRLTMKAYYSRTT